jgi:hypothetical protein
VKIRARRPRRRASVHGNWPGHGLFDKMLLRIGTSLGACAIYETHSCAPGLCSSAHAPHHAIRSSQASPVLVIAGTRVPVHVLACTLLVKKSVGRTYVKKSQPALQGDALALAIPEVPS